MSVNPPPPPGSFPGPPPGYNPPPPPPPPHYQQQQSYPPPAYGQAPMAPPPAKKNWLPWVIGGCGCLVVAAAIAAFVIFAAVKAGTAGAEESVKSFLAAAGQGRYQEAYGYFSEPLKATQGYEEFEATASANSHLFQIKDTTFNERSVDTTSAKLAGSVTLASGTDVPAKFDLVQENGAWKILNYSIGTSD